MQDAIDSDFRCFGKPPRESASAQVGINSAKSLVHHLEKLGEVRMALWRVERLRLRAAGLLRCSGKILHDGIAGIICRINGRHFIGSAAQ
jgi:hypothetical protein